MAPFRDLVKHNQTFTWNKTLDTLFLESKKVMLEKITEGIMHLTLPDKHACRQT